MGQKTYTLSLHFVHIFLSIQTLVIILASINRLGRFTLDYAASNEFLRWVDLLNMLPLPLISTTASFLLLKETERLGILTNPKKLPSKGWLLLFVLSVYVLGVSYGDHEVTNYLHHRFCRDQESIFCKIIVFHDDDFSHWLFFGAFTLINFTLMSVQAGFPYGGNISLADLVLIITNALFIALGIFANLAFEEIGADMYVVAFITTIALYLRVRYGAQPLLIYYSVAYGLGLLATGLWIGFAG